MNSLIVVPWQRDFYVGTYFFPLGLGYISAALKQCGDLRVHTLNLNQVGEGYQVRLLAEIEEKNIKAILIGGMFPMFREIKQTLKMVKESYPSVITVVGGRIVTGDPEATMTALQYADYGIIGEGEVTVVELCRAIKNKGDVSEVKGLIFKKGADFHLTPPRPDNKDLSALPCCDYDGFGFDQYLAQNTVLLSPDTAACFSEPYLAVLPARSCKNHCTFCHNAKGSSYRERESDDFFNELELMLSKYPEVKSIAIFNEMLGMSNESLKTFCQRIKTYKLPWSCFFRVIDFNRENAAVLRDSGCEMVSLGLESASDKILKSMRKGITISQIEAALKLGLEMGLKVIGNFILGDPEETLETAQSTLNWYLDHPEYNIRLNQLMHYPGAAIYWQAVENGKIADRVKFIEEDHSADNFTRMSNDEFTDLIRNKIPDYRRRRYLKLPELKDTSLDLDNGKLTMTGVCPHCGKNLAYRGVYPIVKWVPFICEHCARLNGTSAAYDRFFLEMNLKVLKEKYSRLVFWGLGKFFEEHIHSDLLADEDIFLVDGKKSGFLKKKRIIEPAALRGLGVKCAIIPTRYITQDGRIPSEEIESLARELGISTFVDSYKLVCCDLRATWQ